MEDEDGSNILHGEDAQYQLTGFICNEVLTKVSEQFFAGSILQQVGLQHSR